MRLARSVSPRYAGRQRRVDHRRLPRTPVNDSRRAHCWRKQSFIVFVVRDDERQAPMVFQSSVTTFAAYNNWGGKSLYAFNSGDAPARKVSFDRPYAANPYGVRLDGASDFLRRWEYNAVRFLEREGYDLTYVTDIDTHQRTVAGGARIFLSVGHDEYWSWEMREHVEGARDRGVHLAFLGGGACFWQIRLEPNARGEADRTIVAYKEAAGDLDPVAIDGTPQNNRLITGRWRDRPTSRPEERLIGVMYAADPVDADIIVSDAAIGCSPARACGTATRFAACSATSGCQLRRRPGDARTARAFAIRRAGRADGEGAADQVFGHDDLHGRERRAGVRHRIDAVELGPGRYNAPGWHSQRVSEPAQRMTRNVLGRMLQRGDSRGPAPSPAEPDCRDRRGRGGGVRPSGLAQPARPGW